MTYAIEWWRKRALESLAETERRALARSRWADWALAVGVAALVAAAAALVAL